VTDHRVGTTGAERKVEPPPFDEDAEMARLELDMDPEGRAWEPVRPQQTRARRKRLYTWQELRDLPPPSWLVEGIVPEGLTRLYGPPTVGKTFIMLHWALELAMKGVRVVFVAGEGRSGIPKRIKAWLQHRGLGDHPLKTLLIHDGAVDMLDKRAVREFAASVKGFGPHVVVVDNLARCFGDGDENSARDMNLFTQSCDLLRELLELRGVWIIHHAGKDVRRGGRGSSAGLGAVDCEIEMSLANGRRRVECRKMKDAPEFEPLWFDLRPMHGSCVLIPAGAKISASAKAVLDLVPEAGGIPVAEWREKVYSAADGTAEAKKKAFQRARDELVRAGKIKVEDDVASRV
jgi:hypothetical protein